MPADVASSLKNWSTTAGSNSPAGSTAISTNLDDNLREIQAVVRAEVANSATVASASTTDLGAVDSHVVNITGTTAITGLGTVSAGIRRKVYFSGVLTLTHNGTSLILPTGANITTAAGDAAEFLSLGSGNWRCLWYQRANGIEVGVPALVSGQFLTTNGTVLQWAPASGSIVTVARTTNYTLQSSDRGALISCTNSITVTIPAAATTGAGWWLYLENAGTGQVTLSATSSVDGLSSYVMYSGERRLLINEGGTTYRTVVLRGGLFEVTSSGSGNFIAPPGVSRFNILAVGAGGAGGLGNGTTGGQGGTGGSVAFGSTALVAGTTYAWEVGSGTAGASKVTRLGTSGAIANALGGTDGASASVDNTSTPHAAGLTHMAIFNGGIGGAGGTSGAAPNAGGSAVFGGGGGGGGVGAFGGSANGGLVPSSSSGGTNLFVAAPSGAAWPGAGGAGATIASGTGANGGYPGGGGGGAGWSNTTTRSSGGNGYLAIWW